MTKHNNKKNNLMNDLGRVACVMVLFVATYLVLTYTRTTVSGQVNVSCPPNPIPQMRNCGGPSVCTYNGNCGQLLGINCCGGSPAVTNTVTPSATPSATKSPTPTSTFIPTPTPHPLLLAWYTFNEGGGSTIIDYKAFPTPGNNGVLTTYTNPPLPWVTHGISSPYALNYDGNADHVYVANSDIFNNLTTQMTVLAWVKPAVAYVTGYPNPANWAYISHRTTGGKPAPNDQQFELGYSGWTGSWQFKPFNGAVPNSTPYPIDGTPQTLVPGQWQHIAGVLNGAQVQIYENAVLKGQRNDFVGTLNDGPTASHMTIGGDNWSGNFMRTFNGQIDEFRIYSVARTQPEIYADMHYWDTPTPLPITSTPTPTPTASCTQKYGMQNNQVAIETEGFTSKVGYGGNSWVATAYTGATGTGAMWGVNDTGRTYTAATALTASPAASRLDYIINFSNTGPFNIWVRFKKITNSTRVHFGINGTPSSTADDIVPTTAVTEGAWVWANSDIASNLATVFIPTVGDYVFSIWEGEDGSIVDKIIITQQDSSALNPNIFDPPSATLGACPASPTATPTFGVRLTKSETINPVPGGNVTYEYTISNDAHAPEAAWAFSFLNNLPNNIVNVTWSCTVLGAGVRTGEMNAYPTSCSSQAPAGQTMSGNRVSFGHTGLGEPLIHPGGSIKVTVNGKVASHTSSGTVSHTAAISPYPDWVIGGTGYYYSKNFLTQATPTLYPDLPTSNNYVSSSFVITALATATPSPTATILPTSSVTPTLSPTITPTPIVGANCADPANILTTHVNGEIQYYCRTTNNDFVMVSNGVAEILNSPNTKVTSLTFTHGPKINGQEIVTVSFTATSTRRLAGYSSPKSKVYSFTIKIR